MHFLFGQIEEDREGSVLPTIWIGVLVITSQKKQLYVIFGGQLNATQYPKLETLQWYHYHP